LGVHVLGGHVLHVLCERPVVAFGILGAVGAVAVELVGGRVEDRGTGRLGCLVVLVDVVDVHVDELGRTAPPLGILVVGSWVTHHHDTRPHLQLGVDGFAIGTGHADTLLEPERVDQPVDCGVEVLIEEVRRNLGTAFGRVLHHGVDLFVWSRGSPRYGGTAPLRPTPLQVWKTPARTGPYGPRDQSWRGGYA